MSRYIRCGVRPVCCTALLDDPSWPCEGADRGFEPISGWRFIWRSFDTSQEPIRSFSLFFFSSCFGGFQYPRIPPYRPQLRHNCISIRRESLIRIPVVAASWFLALCDKSQCLQLNFDSLKVLVIYSELIYVTLSYFLAQSLNTFPTNEVAQS